MKRLILAMIVLVSFFMYGCTSDGPSQEEVLARMKVIQAVKDHHYTDITGKEYRLEEHMELVVEGAKAIADGTSYNPNGKLSYGTWDASRVGGCQGIVGETCYVVTYNYRDIMGSWFVGINTSTVIGSDRFTVETLCGNHC